MSVFYGGGEQKSIYYGSKKIDKIYKGNTLVYSSGPSLVIGVPTRFDYTGKPQTVKVDKFKKLQIDAVGGCGGTRIYDRSTDSYGLGGRVQCILNVSEINTIYLYVGGKGMDATGARGIPEGIGGWNGGGNAGINTSNESQAGGGGGATDIRTIYSENPLNEESLNSRIVVAGGAAGSGDQNYDSSLGGNGGGTKANSSYMNSYGLHTSFHTSTSLGGGQTSGGVLYETDTTTAIIHTETAGSLGKGGDGIGTHSGGGGGYYGGAGGRDYAGGGGSSYTDPTLCSEVIHTKAYYDVPKDSLYKNTIPVVEGSDIPLDQIEAEETAPRIQFEWKGVRAHSAPTEFTGHGYIIITPLS